MLAKTAFYAFALMATLAIAPAAQAAVKDRQPAQASKPTVIETGIATWYGSRHSHRYTASGERFRPETLTAAHRSLPLGSLVKVTDMATGRSVVVKVNDREPPHGRRCIDLSEGAARALGIRSQGVATVTITALEPSEPVEVAEAPEPRHHANP